ncbi:LacI family DNA-binding transcriptional regulator [Gracilinema caldarium]|uniref:LacI family DNA-binding transcriptional regulator n=1 Tax=Gracilinema caldarium TaxID=215591 RepID=UPI0026EB5463|nr:LacI family DNA-binding transcriptional regulator [Gracilinema caldarium]
MVTIYDLAKKLGLSPPTISKALNDQPDISQRTKEKVRKLAEELGYTPNSSARGLITKKNWLIGMIYEEEHLGLDVEHPLFAGIMNSFKARIERAGYELLIISRVLGNKKLSYLEHCRYRQVDGILILNSTIDNPEVLHVIHSEFPIVSANIVYPHVCTVTSDNKEPSMQAVRYLYSLGHRRIAFIAGPSEYSSSPAIERLEGYILGLHDIGLEYDPELVVYGHHWNVESGYNAMKDLHQRKIHYTAIYCAADVLALGVMKYCQESDICIPDDLSLIGFDDSQWASYSHPPLTTFRQNRHAIGEFAAEALLKKINGEDVDERICVPVGFIERQTCKKIDEFYLTRFGKGSTM